MEVSGTFIYSIFEIFGITVCTLILYAFFKDLYEEVKRKKGK